jgi:hypothetical protein
MRAQFRWYALPLDSPVLMLNLLRFHPVAQYVPADPEFEAEPVSGRAVYARYSQEASPVFVAVGGKQVWIARPELVLIGPPEETWDLVFVAAPTARRSWTW